MPESAVVFGKGSLAIHAIEVLRSCGYQVPFAVPVYPEPTWNGSLTVFARREGIRVASLEELMEAPEGHWSLGLSVYYDRIFRSEHIQRFRRLLNVHNSLLPKYRGVAPVNWALHNGETRHGVTLHEVTTGIDDGPILTQVSFEIDPVADEVEDVYQRCLRSATTMLSDALPVLDSITPTRQSLAESSYYSTSTLHLLGDRRWLRRG